MDAHSLLSGIPHQAYDNFMTEDQAHESDAPRPASAESVAKVIKALRNNNIDARVVDTREEAKRVVLALLPQGAEVQWGKSKTLQDVGLTAELESGRYDSVQARMMKMDRQIQAREIRKLMAAPDFMLGSVQAVTEAGDLVAVSASSSQLGPYASGAGRVILVVGSQKIVRNLDEATHRIETVVYPYEDALIREKMMTGTFIGKLLIIWREWIEGRTTVILVREPVGI
jgi:hypothetical protein